MRFKARLFKIGKASVKAPSGARGRRILIAPSYAAQLTKDFVNKSVWLHDGRNHRTTDDAHIGIITAASIDEGYFTVTGEIHRPELLATLQAQGETLGASYDIRQGRVLNPHRTDVWRIVDGNPIGFNVLLQRLSAHQTDANFEIVET